MNVGQVTVLFADASSLKYYSQTTGEMMLSKC